MAESESAETIGSDRVDASPFTEASEQGGSYVSRESSEANGFSGSERRSCYRSDSIGDAVIGGGNEPPVKDPQMTRSEAIREARGLGRVVGASSTERRGEVAGAPDRPQDGQRAAAGARAARRGAGAGPPEAALGPAILAAAQRCGRQRRQPRRHLPKGTWYSEQTNSGKVSKAQR